MPEVMAIASVQSTLQSVESTLRIASELVRTSRPSRSESRGSQPRCRHFIRSGTEPMTPPLNTTPPAVTRPRGWRTPTERRVISS